MPGSSAEDASSHPDTQCLRSHADAHRRRHVPIWPTGIARSTSRRDAGSMSAEVRADWKPNLKKDRAGRAQGTTQRCVAMAGKKKTADQDLRAEILRLIRSPKYRPLDKIEIANALGYGAARRNEVRRTLRDLEQAGEIARIRKNRYVLPDAADLVTGTLSVHEAGYAFLTNEKPGQADLFHRSGEHRHRHARRSGGRADHSRRGIFAGTHAASRRPRHPDSDARERDDRRHPAADAKFLLRRAGRSATRSQHLCAAVVNQWPSETAASATRWWFDSRPGNRVTSIRKEKSSNCSGRALHPAWTSYRSSGNTICRSSFHAPCSRKHPRFPETVLPMPSTVARIYASQFIVTIDPDDARDFDDAIHVEEIKGGWQLGVHIADVSAYVRPGSALDREAQRRGNSVYLPDRVIPMLPERLSNGVCSLNPHVDRLTHSVFLQFDRNGRMRQTPFCANRHPQRAPPDLQDRHSQF